MHSKNKIGNYLRPTRSVRSDEDTMSQELLWDLQYCIMLPLCGFSSHCRTHHPGSNARCQLYVRPERRKLCSSRP